MKKLLIFAVLVLATISYQPSTGFAALKDNLSESYAYPNPVRTAIGQNKVTFENLTTNVKIRIFRINGDMVKEIDATDTTGQVVWDLTNDAGQQVGSAIYLYLITNSDSQKTTGKLAIIR